jgi:hypothetical protein
MASTYDKASLVMIPSGTKTSKIFSQKPVNGDGDFTFSRSTGATRVNADGNIEKETQNLALQSNSFNNWTNYLTTETGGQADRSGGTSAWLLEKTGSGGSIYRTHSTSGVATFSAYVKAGTLNWVRLDFTGGGSKGYFDLQNGVVGSVTGSPIDSAIEDAGNGWYRCSITTTSVGSGVGIVPAESDGSISGTSGNIYIQDAQLEQGLVARDYIETTTTAVEGGITDNVPRLDYTDSSCPALLLEPQRTNIAANSEHMLGFTKGSASSLEANAATSPEGKNNATYFYCNTTTTNAYLLPSFSGTSGVQYSVSFYAKAKELSLVYIKNVNDSGSQSYFDLSNGTFTLLSGIDSMSIEDAGNGWYRCTAVSTSTTTGIKWIPILKGDANEGVYVYGLQIEQASYATSYIPTYGTSVTRNEDGYNNTTGISGLLGSTTGTFFVDMERFNTEDRDSAGGTFELRSSNGQTELNIDIEANGSTRAFYRDGGSFNFIYQSSVLRGKFCFVYNGANLKLYHNGVKQFDSNALSSQDFSQLIYTGLDGAKKHHQIMIFPTALTDQEAIDLTTI